MLTVKYEEMGLLTRLNFTPDIPSAGIGFGDGREERWSQLFELVHIDAIEKEHMSMGSI